MKLAISSYSFYRFGQGVEPSRPSFPEMIERCAGYGVDGIELLGDHFSREDLEPEQLGPVKRLALRKGIQICAVSALHNFVNPDVDQRREQIAIVERWIDVAAYLGAPVVRVWGGRWRTITSFEEYMAKGGHEPNLPGYTDDDAFAWSIESFHPCVEYAGRHGVTLGLENHWGLTGTAEGTLRIMNAVNSPWLKIILDTGNFLPDADVAAELRMLAPHAVMVHAKTYLGGGLNYESRTDLAQSLVALRDAGYRGYLSLEFEGKAHPDEGIPAGLEELRRAMASAAV